MMGVFASVAIGAVAEQVKTYTGCLTTNGGTLNMIKEGQSPQKPCPSGSVPVRFSGGDITKISVGEGLKLGSNGGDNGDVAIELDSRYALPQSCTTGKVAKWDGSGWTCGTDNDTTYSEGTGLSLSGTTFSIAPGYRVQNDKTCDSGQFVRRIDGSGAIVCAAPPSGSSEAFIAREHNPGDGTNVFGILSDNANHELVKLDLPAGTYAISAAGSVACGYYGNDTCDDSLSAECSLFAGETPLQTVKVFDGDPSNIAETPIAFTSAAALSSAGNASVRCKTGQDGMWGVAFDIVAVRVASATGL
jgi:hypothetical protein